VLHLLGFDHQTAADARKMEIHESSLMTLLGHPDPYAGQIS
jgi:ssRNA-specific RNase YbeY (16S rRNA maturation enzyme)